MAGLPFAPNLDMPPFRPFAFEGMTSGLQRQKMRLIENAGRQGQDGIVVDRSNRRTALRAKRTG